RGLQGIQPNQHQPDYSADRSSDRVGGGVVLLVTPAQKMSEKGHCKGGCGPLATYTRLHYTATAEQIGQAMGGFCSRTERELRNPLEGWIANPSPAFRQNEE